MNYHYTKDVVVSGLHYHVVPADKLYHILMDRHPDENPEKVKELAYNWVGYEPNEE
jgi:UDP-N-acetylglucosamine transferase subunit ALG13